jgi:hypothetical protein
MRRKIKMIMFISVLFGILTFLYVFQLVFVMFVLINPLGDKDTTFTNKKEFLKNLIPFYFVYKKYKELEE